MANHSSIHSAEPLSFPAMYRLQSQGQRSNSFFQNGSVSRMSHYEDNFLGDIADNCATTGPSINGVDEQLNSAYWDMQSLVSSQPVELSRTKTFSGAYDEKWSSSSPQQETVEGYRLTGGNQQKLDSFSEAFYGRGNSKIIGGGEQVGYNVHSNNSPPNPAVHPMSFPLVLSPPPTPLPPSSLSPPKQGSHLPSAQSLNQGQSHSPSEGPLRFFPLTCCSPTLPGSFPTTHWLSLPTDVNGNREATQHLPQDPSPSSVFQGGLGLHLSVTERDTDCSLDTSPCSPLVQQAPPPSISKPEQEQGPVTSGNHMTWSQMMLSSQHFGNPLHPSETQTEELKICEDTKPSSGFQKTHLLFSSSQSTASVIYTGVPFHSVLQLGVLGNYLDQVTPHYTPLPMLNPTRNGIGLFCNLLPPINKELWSEETWPSAHERQTRHVNIGPEFQAMLPDLLDVKGINMCKEPLREDLLWKPWAELEKSEVLQERVENLLDLSASTALPGCAANLELALHSLSICQGKILAALDIMFFSNSAPSRDYHYTGRDVWLLNEQKLFRKAFDIHGKDFSLIHKMVKTKQVSQCVEFYYHSKKLSDKQRKQKEKEKQDQQQQPIDAQTLTQNMMPSKITMNPMNVSRLFHTPSLASNFPCKQCGKMFYKIKSRNAHMKIHRQQQEDWRERLHANNHLSLTQAMQNQNRTLSHPPSPLVTQSHPNQISLAQSIQNLVQAQAQLAFIQSGKTQSACFTTGINNMSSTQNLETAPKTTALPIYTGHQQTWGALHGSLESSLYYD